jgi:SAM-dependent methyltransferase
VPVRPWLPARDLLARSLQESIMDSIETVNFKTRQAYNLAAQRYHDLFHDEMNQKEYDRNLLDRFANNFTKDSLLCDAGCGPSGHIGRYIFDKGIPVVGVDIAERCVELARKYNPLMPFERCDMAELPFEDGTLDGVIAYYSIIDTPKSHVGRLFCEFHRVLKPGGRLLVAVKAGTTEGYLSELLGVKTPIYLSLFTRNEIRSYYLDQAFSMELLEERGPYKFEIASERIFAIGRKE